MQRLLFLSLFFLVACAAHEKKIGGEEVYKGQAVDVETDSTKFVKTFLRDDPKGFQEKAYHPPAGSLKRVGFIFFETIIQSTRGGLSGEDNYFFTNHAKQIYTETLYKKWQEKLKKWDPRLEVVMVEDQFVKNTTYSGYINDFIDYTTELGENILPDDIQYLVRGKNTSINNLMMPRKFKDLSLMSAPVATLIGGTKPSDYHKYWLNEVAAELNLDVLLVVYTEIDWNRQGIDVLDPKKIIPEGGKMKIEGTLSLPFKKYQSLLKNNGYSASLNPGSTAFRAYEERAIIDLKIEKPVTNQSAIEAFEEHVWKKMFSAYEIMVEMMTNQMQSDLVGTLQ
ncbi:MAG: hypothetical protein ACOYL6_06910 [Bacteriovoracaceae bacterium]